MTEFLYEAFNPQYVDFIGNTLGMYRFGVVLLGIAITCAIAAIIVLIARFTSTAGGLFVFSLVAAVVGALLTFINLGTGHERYTMIQDLQSAGWRVIALDESAMFASPEGAVTDTSSCTFTPPTS